MPPSVRLRPKQAAQPQSLIHRLVAATFLGPYYRAGRRSFGGRRAPTTSPQQLKGGDPSGTFTRWFSRNSGPLDAPRGAWLIVPSQGSGNPLEDARRLIVTRATVSNGRTLQSSCDADNLGPHVKTLGQERRSPQGLRRFLSSSCPKQCGAPSR